MEVRSGRLCCQISSCPYNLNFLFPEGLIVNGCTDLLSVPPIPSVLKTHGSTLIQPALPNYCLITHTPPSLRLFFPFTPLYPGHSSLFHRCFIRPLVFHKTAFLHHPAPPPSLRLLTCSYERKRKEDGRFSDNLRIGLLRCPKRWILDSDS